MVAITGQVRLDLVHKESHQYVDVVDMLRPVTKWNARIERPETVPEVVRKAFKVAEAERPGPTHLELSETIAAAELPSLDAARSAAAGPSASRPTRRPSREAAGDHPRGAAGRCPRPATASSARAAAPALRALCEHAGIPACPTFMGKGALDDRSLLSLPAVGVQARDSMTAGLDEADVVICVGYDLVEFGPAGLERRRDAKRIVHIDAQPGRGRRRTTSPRSSWSATSATPSRPCATSCPPGPCRPTPPACGWRSPPSCARRPSARGW